MQCVNKRIDDKMEDNLISFRDYLQLKDLINNLNSIDNLNTLTVLIKEIAARYGYKQHTNSVDNLISYNDYVKLKAIIENLESTNNLKMLSELIKEIVARDEHKENVVNSLMGKKLQLKITPKCNPDKPEKKYVFKQIEKRDKFYEFIRNYCIFDTESSIKASILIEKYNSHNDEQLAPRLVGLIITDLGKNLPISKEQKPDGTYYKGIKFDEDLIEL